MLQVAQLMANIGLNTAPLVAGMAQAEGIVAGGSKAMAASLALGAAGTAAVLGGIGLIATKMAGDLQSSMTTIATGAGEDAKNLGMLQAGVLSLAKETGTSTDQLVAGLYMIESGGFRTTKALDILKAAAEGAKVGNADLGVVADATDTILKNYGEHGMTAANAVNTLIATVAHGKTHMEEFSDSLAHVLPTAASAGISLNDVMGAMATMTGQGTHAAEAATYLRQTIVALSAPGEQAKQTLLSVGLTAEQVATKMHQSLPAAIQMITDAVGKKFPVGSAGYVAAIRDITGGMRQMQGVLQLGGQHAQTFLDLTKEISGQVRKGGKNIEGWNLVQQTFNQKMAQAGEQVKVLFIQLGEKLLPIATRFAEWLGGTAVPALQHFAQWISGSSDSANKFRPILIAVAAVIAGALATAFMVWAVTAAAAAIATTAALWPILAVGAAIGLLVAGIIWAYNNWGWFRAAVDKARESIGWFIHATGDFLGMVGRAIEHVGGFGNVLKILGLIILGPIGLIILFVTHLKEVGQAMGWLGDRFGELFGHIGEFVGNVLGAIGEFFGNIIDWLNRWNEQNRKAIGDMLGAIGNFIGGALGFIGHLRDEGVKRVIAFKDMVIAKVKELATNFMDALSSLPGKLLALGQQLMQNLGQGIRNGAHFLYSALSNLPLIGGIMGKVNEIVPHFAAGGVMGQSGVALVGEQGPELVRLPAGAQVQPLAPLPASLSGGSGGGGGIHIYPGTVTVQIDGREVALASVRYMPTILRQKTASREF